MESGFCGWLLFDTGESVDNDTKQGALDFTIPLVAAAGISAEGVGILSQQAGLSAYIKINLTSDLASIADTFDSLSYASDKYIVGNKKIIIGGPFTGTIEVSLYADTDGNIVAFQPVHMFGPGGIVHWGIDCTHSESICDSPLDTTLLHKALEFVTRQFPNSVEVRPSFYDWRYPTAEQVLILANLVKSGKDSVQINIPGTATIHESSLMSFEGLSASNYSSWIWTNVLKEPFVTVLNGQELKKSTEYSWWRSGTGILTPGKVHTISVDSGTYTQARTVVGIAVMLIYSR